MSRIITVYAVDDEMGDLIAYSPTIKAAREALEFDGTDGTIRTLTCRPNRKSVAALLNSISGD